MSGANRAKEVIEVISEKCSTTRRNIIGSIFSSKEMYEEISDKLYFEYASKEKPEELKSSALAELGYTNIYEFGGINTWPYETES